MCRKRLKRTKTAIQIDRHPVAVEIGIEVSSTNWGSIISQANLDWEKICDHIRSDDQERGMKTWHIYSNLNMTSQASFTELPWIYLGGIIHEIDPQSASGESGTQGFWGNAIDAPGDIIANSAGMIGGMVLPSSVFMDYSIFVAGLIPGPIDPWLTQQRIGRWEAPVMKWFRFGLECPCQTQVTNP